MKTPTLKTGTRVMRHPDPAYSGPAEPGTVVTHHGGGEYTIRLDSNRHVLVHRRHLTPLEGESK